MKLNTTDRDHIIWMDNLQRSRKCLSKARLPFRDLSTTHNSLAMGREEDWEDRTTTPLYPSVLQLGPYVAPMEHTTVMSRFLVRKSQTLDRIEMEQYGWPSVEWCLFCVHPRARCSTTLLSICGCLFIELRANQIAPFLMRSRVGDFRTKNRDMTVLGQSPCCKSCAVSLLPKWSCASAH